MDFNVEGSSFGQVVAEHEEAVLAMAQTRDSARESIYAKVIKWTLMVGTFLLPLFFLPYTTSVLELNKELLLLGVAGIALVAWLLSVVSTGRLSWRSSPFDKGVIAIGVATLIATIFSVSRYTSIFGSPNTAAMSLIAVLSFVVFYFVAFNSEMDMGERLANVLSLSLVLTLLYGLFQLFGAYVFKFPFAATRAFNTVGSVNTIGVMAAISLPLFKRNVNSWMRYANWLGMVLALAILVVLNWWVLWTIAIAGMVALIAFGSMTQERFSISKFIMPMTVIVLAVFLMIVNFNLKTVKGTLPVEVGPSFQLSGHITKDVLRDKLFTGVGPSMFSIAFDKYGASRLVDSTLSTAKFYGAMSEVFSTVTQGGLVMILALLVMFWGFIQALRAYIKKRGMSDANTAAIWSMAIAAGAAFLLYPYTIAIAFVSVAALTLASLSLWGDRIKNYNVEDNVTLSLTSSLGFIGGLIIVLAGAYFMVSLYLSDVNYANALAEKDINKASSDIVSAINWNGNSDTYYRSASQAALGLLTAELRKKADPKDTQQGARINSYLASSVNLAKQATTLGPQESLNWANLGSVYQSLIGLVDGVDKLSEDAYVKAANLRPGDASFFNAIGNTYITKASFYQQAAAANRAQSAALIQIANQALASAEQNYQRAVSISPNFGLAIYNLGNVYAQENKLNEAIKQLEKIAPFNNDQPNLLFELSLLYYQSNQHDKAFNAFQQVLVLSPDYANAHWYLSLLYEEKNDIPNAVNELNKILSVEANKNNQTVLDRLAKLQANPPQKTTGTQKPL